MFSLTSLLFRGAVRSSGWNSKSVARVNKAIVEKVLNSPVSSRKKIKVTRVGELHYWAARVTNEDIKRIIQKKK